MLAFAYPALICNSTIFDCSGECTLDQVLGECRSWATSLNLLTWAHIWFYLSANGDFTKSIVLAGILAKHERYRNIKCGHSQGIRLALLEWMRCGAITGNLRVAKRTPCPIGTRITRISTYWCVLAPCLQPALVWEWVTHIFYKWFWVARLIRK